MCPSTTRGRLARLLLLAASLVVGLAAGEAFVRAAGVVPPARPPAEVAIVHHYTDPNGAVRMVPGWEGWLSGAPVSLNADGFRDRRHPRRPPAGVRRWVALGDSYTMGDGVAAEETWPKRLEALMDRTEVVNCGISGTNTRNQVAALPSILGRFRPHGVLLAMNLNDLRSYPLTRFEEQVVAGARFEVLGDGRVRVVREPSTPEARWRSFLVRHSALVRLIKRLRVERSEAGPGPLERGGRWLAGEGRSEAVAAARRGRDLAAAEGAELVALLLPALLEVPHGSGAVYPWSEAHAELCAELEAAGVECLDLAPAFAGRDLDGLALRRHDRHYDADGHRLVAEELARRLSGRGGGPPPAAGRGGAGRAR